ncbi:S8 family serine peptidase [Bacteriovoracaceae bacterium]|nr:S8 family serine peptidase [Bacteriovoracaceae bacterium]
MSNLKISVFLFTLSCIASSLFADRYIVKLNSDMIEQVAVSKLIQFQDLNQIKPNLLAFATNQKEKLDQLVEKNMIHYYEKVQPLYLDKAPNDPYLKKQWYLKNDDLAGINIQSSWAKTQGSHKVLVAVVDTGVNRDHPDLANNIFVNKLEKDGKEGVDDDGNGLIDDVYGWNFADKNNHTFDKGSHGTHVAGILGAKGNNQAFIAGINWKIKILPIRIFNDQGQGSTETALQAIYYAADQGAQVINNSYGFFDYSQAFLESIEYARSKNVLLVVSAGNMADDIELKPRYPASFLVDNIIVVAATDEKAGLASFSSFGKNRVHIGAPGMNIYSTTYNDYAGYMSGTSMAAPMVTGAAALYLSLHKNISYKKLKNSLLNSAIKEKNLVDKIIQGRRLNIGALIKSK